MTQKQQIKSTLIQNLEAFLDAFMLEMGFERKRGGLCYRRNVYDTMQLIDLNLQGHPSDEKNASAVVYPFMEIHNKSVDDILKDMIGDDLGLLEGVSAGTSRQPIELHAEKRGSGGRWFLYQADSVPVVVKAMQAFIAHWTIPFLDAFITATDIVRLSEHRDRRLVWDRAQMMRSVAASIAVGRRDNARAIMAANFSGTGSRRRYQKVYDYIERLQ